MARHERRRRMRTPLLALALVLLSHSVPGLAAFGIPDIELVHSVPLETDLATPDLRGTAEAWSELFDSATHSIDLGAFYAANAVGSALDEVIEHLQAAGERGVKIRFLMEEQGMAISDPATLERLERIPNLTFRTLAYAKVGGGIIHAKYFVVDGKRAFVGSQNFDWRSLEHIHETGLRIDDVRIAAQLQAIFDQDWQAQAALAKGEPIPQPTRPSQAASVDMTAGSGNYLVASPVRFNPVGVGDSQAELLRLLNAAQHEIRVQLLDYAPLSYGPGRPYYPPIDTALRAAAARGVDIKLLVSNWNTGKPEIDYLKSLAVLPHVQVRIATLPPSATGFIPYARVIHSKTMEIDRRIAWVGTSNWLGGYLDKSRNLEVVMHSVPMAERIERLHAQLWDGPYVQPIKLDEHYPEPHPGTP